MKTPNVPATGWFTSSYSTGQGANCVEVHLASDAVHVRHSRHPADAVIRYTQTEWHTFTRSMKAGEFDPATSAWNRPTPGREASTTASSKTSATDR